MTAKTTNTDATTATTTTTPLSTNTTNTTAGADTTTTVRKNVGPQTMAVLTPLFALALLVYTVRIWTRVRPKSRLNAADYMITAAMFAETICFICTAIAVANGFGRGANSLAEWDTEIIGRSTFVVYIVGFWASCFARISVACLLLQFTLAQAWRAALWAMITLQVLLMVGCNLVVLLQCRPIRATWAQVPGAKCLSSEDNWKMGYSFTGVSMFSDVLFAVMPIALVWRLSRSPVERLLLSVLLGLGLLGVVAGAIRVATLSSFHLGSGNVVADMMPVYLWSRIEEIVIISAACAPLLKGPIEGMLYRRFGWSLTSTPPRGHGSVHSLPPGVSGRRWMYSWSQRTTQKTSSTEGRALVVESKQGTQGTVVNVATPAPVASGAKGE